MAEDARGLSPPKTSDGVIDPDRLAERRSVAADLYAPDESIRVASSPLDGRLRDLPAVERAYVETAVASRQSEFSTGRRRARELLGEFGIVDFTIARDADRVPIWPDSIRGSISHTKDWCFVAIAKDTGLRGLGVDVEVDQRLKPELLDAICSASEQADWVADRADGLRNASAIFSIKEAVYKACFPELRERWGFMDVRVELALEDDAFLAHPPASVGRSIEGRVLRRGGLIFSEARWR